MDELREPERLFCGMSRSARRLTVSGISTLRPWFPVAVGSGMCGDLPRQRTLPNVAERAPEILSDFWLALNKPDLAPIADANERGQNSATQSAAYCETFRDRRAKRGNCTERRDRDVPTPSLDRCHVPTYRERRTPD